MLGHPPAPISGPCGHIESTCLQRSRSCLLQTLLDGDLVAPPHRLLFPISSCVWGASGSAICMTTLPYMSPESKLCGYDTVMGEAPFLDIRWTTGHCLPGGNAPISDPRWQHPPDGMPLLVAGANAGMGVVGALLMLFVSRPTANIRLPAVILGRPIPVQLHTFLLGDMVVQPTAADACVSSSSPRYACRHPGPDRALIAPDGLPRLLLSVDVRGRRSLGCPPRFRAQCPPADSSCVRLLPSGELLALSVDTSRAPSATPLGVAGVLPTVVRDSCYGMRSR